MRPGTDGEPIRRRSWLLAAAVLAALAAPSAAQARDVVLATGNFHLPGKEAGCRWWSYGPKGTPAGLGKGAIRCEKYAGRVMVEISKGGYVGRTPGWKGWINPGTRSVRSGFLDLPKFPHGSLTCHVLRVYSIPAGRFISTLRCTATTGRYTSKLSIDRGSASVSRRR